MLFSRLKYSLVLALVTFSLSAQNKEKTDSLVRLLGCDELQQVEFAGYNIRKALGHARFEHNSTLLICDTAVWNVTRSIINAFGHVRIIQNQTVLDSDKLDYFIDDNLAQFRGTVVQLQDKQKNTLRTRDLDYNTKDSVATFKNGGAFRDKDGQIIESVLGTYDSKIKTFTFSRNVNMYTDSVFVKTEKLDFNTGTNIALFGAETNAWRDDNMLSANTGWYKRNDEIFLFQGNVHLLTPKQEAWSDSLKYYKIPNDIEMFGHVELLDTTRNVAAVAGYMRYVDSLSYIKMTRDPAVIAVTTQNEKKDTAYMGADTLIYWTVKKNEIGKSVIKDAERRLEEINVDPVSEYRRKAAEQAKAAAEQAKKKMEEEDPNAAGAKDKGKGGAQKNEEAGAAATGGRSGRGVIPPHLPGPWDDCTAPVFPEYSFSRQRPDSLAVGKKALPPAALPDSSLMKNAADSLMKNAADSVSLADSLSKVPEDTTKIGFLLGIKNVKVYRSDMQVCCDSLAYTDLDSLIRLYDKPVVWNEITRQYYADSITVIVKNQTIDRASLMSNAFIITQEDSICYDQIKGAEMMAYFDSTGTLKRFDAMGGASGLFYIKEHDALATVNKFESKMLTASFKEGNINDLNYFDAVKSDAYPVVQLKKDDKILKGFDWQPDKRPADHSAITSLSPRESERTAYEAVPKTKFPQTDIYFPGYMKSVYKTLATQDSLKQVRNAERKRLEEERKAAERIAADSLSTTPLDSLDLNSSSDSLGVINSLSEKDSLLAGANKLPPSGSLTSALNKNDTLSVAKDTLSTKKDSSAVSRQPLDSLSSAPKPSVVIDQKEIEKAKANAAKAQEKARIKAEAAQKKAKKENADKEKQAAKEAQWAKLDAKDAEKAKVKEEKALKKKRANTLKTLKAVEKREAAEQKALDRYKARYEKKKARQDERKAAKAKRDSSAKAKTNSAAGEKSGSASKTN